MKLNWIPMTQPVIMYDCKANNGYLDIQFGSEDVIIITVSIMINCMTDGDGMHVQTDLDCRSDANVQ